MVLTYPGSGFILIAIIGAYLLLHFATKTPPPLKLLVTRLSVIFGIWYCYIAWSEVRIVGSIWKSLIEVLRLELPIEKSMTHPFAIDLTPLFKNLIYTRMIIEGGIIMMSFLIALYKYTSTIISRLRGGNSKVPFVYALILASLIAPAPWLLTEWSRWSFYKFNQYFLLFSLISLSYYIYVEHHLKLSKISTKILAIIAITFAILLVPLLRYTSIPYLNVTTPELQSTSFVHVHFAFDSNCYYLEYPPYIRMLVSGDTKYEIFSAYWFENVTLGLYVVTDRALTRDGFYLYPQTLQVRLKELENFMIIQGDKVYDNEYNRIYHLK
jgi:hypothetical protein